VIVFCRSDAARLHGDAHVRPKATFQCFAAQRLPGVRRKDRIALVAGPFVEPAPKHRDDCRGEGRDSLLASFAGFIVHLYMGLAVVPGGLSAITHGEVTEEWARHHHPLWLDEVTRRRRGDPVS